ncbi:YkvA family protein [Pedobacter sp. BMA]|uniref:YkvA family protein n=1 Tax=Pedobacter sp. BMA TaxID=1663685 RepID=UPI00064A20F5|nr:YkvA family protein [Pedobacter sp. BMA]KLT65217.1 methyltransferase type 11 [Pedobacter sp. BMA]
MGLSTNKILNLFKKSQSRASAILKDKSKASVTVENALGKAVSNRSDLEGVWDKMVLLLAVSKDFINGNYTAIPKRSIIAILGGLVYFLSPIDVVPDFVPVLGFIDDIFVLNLVYKQVLKDLEEYKTWKSGQGKLVSIDGES